MKSKLLRLIAINCMFIAICDVAAAQSFSFNCIRDTLVPGCPANLCITLKGKVPDIKGLSTSYTLNPTSSTAGCFPVYVRPDDPAGTPTGLAIDDKYSGVINIGFPFSFYGTLYNSLVASTNGYVSFDVGLAFGDSHWEDFGDLPNFSYDAGLIMGPYHDLFPGVSTSPNQRIQYQLFGIAPHRRWILSFFQVPLFSCTSLFQNTHQIVLYESTGIIEVTIFSKQICGTWQGGKAMVGIQDMTRSQGMTAPQRKMSDPAWGSIGMNESWRFVPNSGNSLFKRAELYDLSGTLITTGTATSLGNGQLDVSFPNVCAPAGATTSYIIKSVYEKIDDPNVEIFGTDTVRVNRSAALSAIGSSTPANCGSSNGTITVTSVTGGTPPYEYSLDGVIWQSANSFTGLPANSYTVYIRDAGGACNTTIPVTVALVGNLPGSVISTAASCNGINDGTITVNSAGGTGPYTFSLDGGPAQAGTIPFVFSNVAGGPHSVVIVDLSNGCSSNPLPVTVITGPGVTGATNASPTGCSGATNGSITTNVFTGTPPFTYYLDGGSPQTTTSTTYTYNNVSSGPHNIMVADNAGCSQVFPVNVPIGPPFSISLNTNPTTCAGATNGSVTVTAATGVAPYSFSIDGSPVVAGGLPFTFNNVSAGPHVITLFDALSCASNMPANVGTGPGLSTTVNKTDVLCNGGATGTITVVQPSVGTAPFEYSLDGTNWQASNSFTGLIAGPYTVYYRESNGCQGSQNVTIQEPTLLQSSNNTTAVVCYGQSNGVITASASGGVPPYEYSINGGTNWQSSPIFNVAVGSYTIITRDANGCTDTKPANVTEPSLLSAVAIGTDATCDGGNDGTITVNANGGNSGYLYSIDGINFQSSNIFNVAPGPYTVTIKDALGCTATAPVTIGLNNNLTMTPQADATICESKSAQLEFISNATTYSWSPSTALSDPGIYNPVANPVTTTEYVVTATLGRCTITDTVNVIVNTAPIPDAGAPGFICFGQSYTLQGSGGSVYTWSPSTYLDDANNQNPVSTPDKTITYTLSVVDNNGCNSLVTDEITIDVTPPITVNTFPFDTIAYPGDKFRLLATSIAPKYSWSPSIGLSDPLIADPELTIGPIGSDQVYKVMAYNDAGCKGYGYVTIRVYAGPEIYVPNAFTPDNDGKNDRFYPFPVGIKKLNYFKVFNRWGNIVFSTTTLNQGWDGNMKGVKQSTGVYVWMAEAIGNDGRVITKQGTVTLIR